MRNGRRNNNTRGRRKIGLGFITWRINVARFERRVIAFTIQSTGEVIRRSVMSILIRRSSVVLRKSVEYYSTPCVSNIQYLYIYAAFHTTIF
jgi:hypothetical protein